MSTPHGAFVWYELMTPDTGAAQRFYSHVVGWGTQDGSQPGQPYTLFTAGENPVAGLMDLPEDARTRGVSPFWLGYVGVDDVDAAATAAQGRGATLHVPPRDIPGIGRFAVFSDPQGATIGLFRWAESMPQLADPGQKPCHVGWHELLAADAGAAFDFYAALFGWQKGEAMDMGPLGKYQLFAHAGAPIGGMFNKPPQLPSPAWLYYFTVPEIDAAAQRVRDGGGTVLNGPIQVPGGDWIVQCQDPQGAMFALVGSRG